MSLWSVVEVLLLIMVANGAPVLLARVAPAHWMRPVDGGRCWSDGRPLLGHSKTWAGIAAAVGATAAAAAVLGAPWPAGVAAGAAAMLGDLGSSFTKRRLGVPPSGQALGVDQIPEALLPALALTLWLPLTAAEVAAAVALFFLLEVPVSMALFRLGVRKKPY